MKNQFKFHMPVDIRMGEGISKKLTDFIDVKSVFIISDPFLYDNGVAKEIGKSFEGAIVDYFWEVEPNPSCESVDKAAEKARLINAECIIGLGGGSALDVSKIVSCLVNDGGSIYDYYSGGERTFSNRKTTLVCIPTTAGTGSEVTNVGVYTNKKAGVKMPMVTDKFWPDYAVVDPILTYTLPPHITASTGMDAFCHAIEAYWNKESQPVCDMLSLGALKIILENIKTAYDNPENKAARAAMIVGSLIAGISFSQTRTTGIHALSFPLTTEFGASHGTACSITLPAFIKISSEEADEKMKALAKYLSFSDVDEMAREVELLMQSMKMPVRLSQLGVKESDLLHIAKTGLNAAIIHLTPAKMNEETVLNLLKSIL